MISGIPESLTQSSSSSGGNIQLTVQLDVMANVPLIGASPDHEQETSNFTTVTVLSFTGTDNGTAFPGVAMHFLVLYGLGANATAKAHGLSSSSQDGSGCRDILSEECITGLLQFNLAGDAEQPPQSCSKEFFNPWQPYGIGVGKGK